MNGLRLTTSDGVVVRDPGYDRVRAVVDATARHGRDAFLVLDVTGRGDAPFLQAVHLGRGAWRVEVWRVAARASHEHYWTLVPDADGVAEVFTSWGAADGRWEQRRWRPMTDLPLAAAG